MACEDPANSGALGGGGVVNQANCAAACNDNFASRCGTPSQPVVVNYIVSASTVSPSYMGNPSGTAATGIQNQVSAASTKSASAMDRHGDLKKGSILWTAWAAVVSLALTAAMAGIF